jgi:tetratricopeptide (TPR) repeat protein
MGLYSSKFLELIKNDDTEALDKFYSKDGWRRDLDFEWLFPELQKYHNGNAFFILGCIYDEKKDKISFEYYQKSANLGNSHALNKLGCICNFNGDFEKALKYFQQSADLGNSNGLYNLGRMYSRYFPPDKEKAFECFYLAMLKNHGKAKLQIQKYFFDELMEKIQVLEVKVENLQMELDCVPEYGKAYLESKKDFESRCVELKKTE